MEMHSMAAFLILAGRVIACAVLTRNHLPTQNGQNKSGAKGAAKNPVWQEEERLGMNPVPGNLQGKST